MEVKNKLFKCGERNIESVRFEGTEFVNYFLFHVLAIIVRSMARINTRNLNMLLNVMITGKMLGNWKARLVKTNRAEMFGETIGEAAFCFTNIQ